MGRIAAPEFPGGKPAGPGITESMLLPVGPETPGGLKTPGGGGSPPGNCIPPRGPRGPGA